jgi:hypothetical protein
LGALTDAASAKRLRMSYKFKALLHIMIS